MSEYTFQSSLAKRIKTFVALKQLSGTPYTTPSLILKCFDRFLVREKFKRGYLTRPIYDRYVATLSNLCPQYRANQCSLIRRLSIYLSCFEPKCYIPDPAPAEKPQKNWRAYIFSKGQIRDILATPGKMKFGHQNGKWLSPHTYRTLFGLLCTTGVRIYKRRSKSAPGGGLIVRHRGYTYPFHNRQSNIFQPTFCGAQREPDTHYMLVPSMR